MKQINKKTFLFALVASLSILACNNSLNKNAVADNSKTTTTQSEDDEGSASTGDASFSANVDGEQVSGGIINEYQQSNTFHIMQSDAGDELVFELNDTKSKGMSTADKYLFQFAVPKKSGVLNIMPAEETWGISLSKMANKDFLVQYHSDSVIVNITTLSPTRVSGTFSGRFMVAGSTPNEISSKYKNVIEVTDGKFDLPFAK